MRKLLIIWLAISNVSFGQSIDFGIEVQNNYNTVENFFTTDPYDPSNLAVSAKNMAGDTANLYFNKFRMETNFEIPLYFRFNLRKRWFFDLKLSNSSNTLTMEGVANYNDGYYTRTYGTYDEFVSNASMQGFTADSADYQNYINSARDLNESDVRTVEEFKLLMFTGNAGIRLFPQKSVKLVLGGGFTIKHKYRKHLFNDIDYPQPHMEDLRSVESGLDWFAEKSTYMNFFIGLELYRFRLSAYSQFGFSYTFPGQFLHPDVTFAGEGTAFDVVRSYGFSMSANLFSMDIGKRVKVDDVSQENLIVSNVKKRKEKWDFGVQYDRRGYNDMFTYYNEPDLRLSVMTIDTVLHNNNGSFVNALDLEMVTLGDIKRIDWGARLSGFINLYFTNRFGVKGSLGGSRLTYDVESTQLKTTILDLDTLGLQYLNQGNSPGLRNAALRKQAIVIDLSTDFFYKVVDRDLFSLKLFAGFGLSGLTYGEFNRNSKKGLNELEVYQKFDEWHSSKIPVEKDFETHQGELPIDLDQSPETLINSFNEPGSEFSLDPVAKRNFYPFFRVGFEASFERFFVGFGLDMSIPEMDRFLLSDYRSIYMSVGYKIFQR